jgi:ribosome-associated translation inhibitor RaiA
MKIQFHVRGLNVNASLRHRLERGLEGLEELISISDAAVVLEHERNNAPAFRVFVLLAVPGPDLHAEARDHTLEAAWLKVTRRLREQIELRRCRPHARAEVAHQVRNGRMVKRAFPRLYKEAVCRTYTVARSGR